MIPFNNPNAVPDDAIANAGGPSSLNLIANVGGGALSESGSNILLQTGTGFIELEPGTGVIQLEA